MMVKKLLIMMGALIARGLGITIVTGTQAAHAEVALN
jgi:hypothetical protein